MSTFGEQLRRLREAAGLTQDELAERAGLSRDAVSALERGHRRQPHPQTTRALAAGLGLSEQEARDLQLAARQSARPASAAAEATSIPLPAPPTPLVGRRRELAELRDLLTNGGTRLVTLTGPGGIGKTRLALELAWLLQGAFPGGVVFVSLATTPEPALIVPTIAEALGVRATSGWSLAERVKQALRDRRPLLVLDNLEHLVWAASPVAELLAACPELTILATSRAALRLSGEHWYPAPPLAVPRVDEPATLARLAATDAVALFVQRARAASPEFALTEANAPAVGAICGRLDGLPLAVELAAARIKLLPPEALLARLGSGIDLLTGGPRDHAPRLRSMKAAIAWSYDLLDPDEQALFRRLAVFGGGFALEAAEAVAAGADAGDIGVAPAASIIDGVGSLIDKSLLHRQNWVDGEPRFAMLTTMQDFGRERLAAEGEMAEVSRAHAAYYLSLAEEAWPAFRQRTGQEKWLDRFDQERGNLRGALRHLDEQGDSGSLLRLAGALFWFWYIRGPLIEGRRWLERALATPAADTPGDVHARALVGAGLLAHFQGDEAQAGAWLEEGAREARDLDDPWLLAFALLLVGIVAEDRGDYGLAGDRFAASLKLFRAAGDRPNAANVLTHLGVAAWGQGDVDRAAELCAEALALQREADDAWGIANSLGYLGLLAGERGVHSQAAAYHRESLRLRHAAGVWEDVAGSLADIAVLAAKTDRSEAAARLFGAAAALREDIGREPKLPERAVFERRAAQARAALGTDAFAAAEAAGRALPREQAIAEAADLADEIADS